VMAEPNLEPDFLGTKNQEKTSWTPWIVAAVVVVLGIGTWAVIGHRNAPPPQNVGTGLAPADPYAASLAIGGLKMSEADSFAGGKVTYIDGQITNNGPKTLNGVTVQVGFKNDLGEYSQRIAVPLSLIRTREPYVDTQAVSAAPIQPGQQRDFRLIFDTVPADWNMQYPDVRVINVRIQ
jgi:hypothetical protein